MNNLEKLLLIEEGVYKICLALVSICDRECCTYSFDEEVETAEEYIKAYEKEHQDEKA